MQAQFTEKFFARDDAVIDGEHKTVTLPFSRVSARAIIVRELDGALIGTLHRQGGRYALPGGVVDDGESTAQTIVRELREENITLQGSDERWQERISVDYFHGYRELALWYVFIVGDADIKPCEENIESRWVRQAEDVWYPLVRERILLALRTHTPALVKTLDR